MSSKEDSATTYSLRPITLFPLQHRRLINRSKVPYRLNPFTITRIVDDHPGNHHFGQQVQGQRQQITSYSATWGRRCRLSIDGDLAFWYSGGKPGGSLGFGGGFGIPNGELAKSSSVGGGYTVNHEKGHKIRSRKNSLSKSLKIMHCINFIHIYKNILHKHFYH